MLKTRGKYSYSAKTYSNPYFNKSKRIKNSNWPWRLKVIGISAAIFAGGSLWALYFSSFFNIKDISVAGNSRFNSEELSGLAWQQTEAKKFKILSQKNINVFSLPELEKKLQSQYNFQAIKISKEQPDKILIEVQEKEYVLIWKKNDQYFPVDSTGQVIYGVSLDEEIKNKYPIIELTDDDRDSIGNDYVNYVIAISNKFSRYKDYKIDKFIINFKSENITMKINNGPAVYFNVRDDADKQLNKLFALIDERLKNDFMKQQYIELRFGERVFYQ